MKIKMGEKVLTQDGIEVGRIERVVMDPKLGEITHVVIEKGVLFKEDRIVPVGKLGGEFGQGVVLLLDENELNDLPEFKSEHFILYSGMNEAMKSERGYATPLIMYPPAGLMRSGAPYLGYPPIVKHIDENIPPETVAIRKGAAVFSDNGKKLGDVEQVFTDPELKCVTYFLISSGLLLKSRKLIPVDWIREIQQNKIKLCVETELVQNLPDYPRDAPESK